MCESNAKQNAADYNLRSLKIHHYEIFLTKLTIYTELGFTWQNMHVYSTS